MKQCVLGDSANQVLKRHRSQKNPCEEATIHRLDSGSAVDRQIMYNRFIQQPCLLWAVTRQAQIGAEMTIRKMVFHKHQQPSYAIVLTNISDSQGENELSPIP